MKRITTALVAAFVLSSATAVLAQEAPYTIEEWNYLRNPNAPVPTYQQALPYAYGFENGLIEGRNVGVAVPNFEGPATPYDVPSDQQHWIDPRSIDFNS
ncbi:MAG: hypothetical protein IT539_11040 [Bradyrhizobiaceae bacterium]|nr:hypothetical protein [Bradyrhizobiaceae bacterium]